MITIQQAYDYGKDCGLRGPNETNCNFRIFATRELTTEWERGKADADRLKAARS